MRTNSTQLPEIDELKAIMEKEAWRDPASGKEAVHYPDFSVAVEWLRALELDASLFEQSLSWEEVLVLGDQLREEVIKRTLNRISEHELLNIVKKVTAYLGEADAPEISELIFVFGSQSTSRIHTAVDLWQKGLAPKIFITGGHPFFKETESEAEVFKNYAIEHGVPLDAMIIESEAITIADNVRRSINLFEEKGINYSRMILVTAWFVQRRSWSFMMKYIPDEYRLYRVNAPVNPRGDYTENGWFKNENGIRLVFGELVKLRIGVALNTA